MLWSELRLGSGRFVFLSWWQAVRTEACPYCCVSLSKSSLLQWQSAILTLLWSSSPDNDDVSAYCMCIVYVYARLAWAFYFCRQDSFLLCMHCHLLSNQKGWFFLLIQTSGPIACRVIFSCLLVPMLRHVCVCAMFVSVSASEKGTEGDGERGENRISCSKPHLWWQQHVSF